MYSGQRTVEGRNESIDERVTRTQNYSRGGKAKRMGYADGGGVKKKTVSAAEAKKIAERTVGEHVRYPAPKGHKGLRMADGGDVRAERAKAVKRMHHGAAWMSELRDDLGRKAIRQEEIAKEAEAEGDSRSAAFWKQRAAGSKVNRAGWERTLKGYKEPLLDESWRHKAHPRPN